MFLYEETHRSLKNDYQFFDALKTNDRKIRGNYTLLTKVKFDELEWSSPLKWVVTKTTDESQTTTGESQTTSDRYRQVTDDYRLVTDDYTQHELLRHILSH